MALEGHHLGDSDESEDIDTTVNGGENFRDQCHANQIGSDPLEEPVFGAGGQAWTRYCGIDPMQAWDAGFDGDPPGDFPPP